MQAALLSFNQPAGYLGGFIGGYMGLMLSPEMIKANDDYPLLKVIGSSCAGATLGTALGAMPQISIPVCGLLFMFTQWRSRNKK